MSAGATPQLELPDRQAWRRWLQKHHGQETVVWLVFHKRHTGIASLGYDEAVEEALCFGWVDSLIRRLDADRYARKFTPRSPGSKWSTLNRKRYAKLEKQGLLAPAGRARPPTQRSGDQPAVPDEIPPYFQEALEANPAALNYFESLAPSSRRMYVAWMEAARREATREKRVRESIALLAAGRKLGLK